MVEASESNMLEAASNSLKLSSVRSLLRWKVKSSPSLSE